MAKDTDPLLLPLAHNFPGGCLKTELKDFWNFSKTVTPATKSRLIEPVIICVEIVARDTSNTLNENLICLRKSFVALIRFVCAVNVIVVLTKAQIK